MEIEEILNCFNHPNGRFPIEALNAAQEKQEQITPRLLNILERIVSDYRNVSAAQMDYIFALYLLSKFREKRAFSYILALASLPEEWPEELLGDCITEALASLIVSTFNDDLPAIKKLIEDETLNEWSRNAGLKSLLGLVALEKLQREDLIDYLRFLFHSPLADNEEFVTHLVNSASDLYPEELMDEINEAFDKDKVDTFSINKKWIERILEQGKQKSLSDNVYNNRFHLPIDDVEKEMSCMIAFHPKQEKKQSDTSGKNSYDWMKDNFTLNAETTHVRSTPKIGRNDTCVCGSGKKFKKCCLGSVELMD